MTPFEKLNAAYIAVLNAIRESRLPVPERFAERMRLSELYYAARDPDSQEVCIRECERVIARLAPPTPASNDLSELDSLYRQTMTVLQERFDAGSLDTVDKNYLIQALVQAHHPGALKATMLDILAQFRGAADA